MACPKCGCKEVYQCSDADNSHTYGMEYCAACGEIFYHDEHTEEESDD